MRITWKSAVWKQEKKLPKSCLGLANAGGGNRYVEGDLLTFGYLMLDDALPFPYYRLIRHRAARHQWSVSNALVRFTSRRIWESLNCFKGPQDPFPDFPGSLGISRDCLHDFFAVMFLLCFVVSIFSDFNSKKHPKIESKSTQNR